MFHNDSFVEQVVKRGKQRPSYYWKVAVSILLIAVSEAMIFLFGRLVTGPVVFIIAIYMFIFVLGYGTLEYEYIFTNGDVEIAGIYKDSKRREFFHFNFDQVTMVAPVDSPHIANEAYHRKNYFGSKRGSDNQIALMVDVNKRKELIIIEPDERSLAHIKTFARSKCYDI